MASEPSLSVADLPLAEIREVCDRLGVQDLALFGSALRGDFGPDSDLDFLVRFRPDAVQPWLTHFQALEDELSKLLGRSIDLADRAAIEKSRNWIRRDSILDSAQVLYAA